MVVSCGKDWIVILFRAGMAESQLGNKLSRDILGSPWYKSCLCHEPGKLFSLLSSFPYCAIKLIILRMIQILAPTFSKSWIQDMQKWPQNSSGQQQCLTRLRKETGAVSMLGCGILDLSELSDLLERTFPSMETQRMVLVQDCCSQWLPEQAYYSQGDLPGLIPHFLP